jgi:hypothetical protein
MPNAQCPISNVQAERAMQGFSTLFNAKCGYLKNIITSGDGYERFKVPGSGAL